MSDVSESQGTTERAGVDGGQGPSDQATATIDRFTLTALEPSSPATLPAEVRAGLTESPKRLPCRFFYDAAGSQLFEAICDLPEYYLTRAEREILAAHAAEIAAGAPAGCDLVELGSGSAAKTRLLIEALLRRQPALRYVPIDISATALEASARQLLADYPRLEIGAIAATYDDGLRYLAESTDLAGRPRLALWLGSNVGNYEREEAATFLRRVARTLGAGDRLLVGVDLRKDRAVLEAAYDDAQGVTARFNKNLLVRINAELGGHFELEAFDHRAVYDEAAGRIEMYLVSRRAQRVPIDRLGITVPFAAGEAIHTENSYKYSVAEIHALAQAAGLVCERLWFDSEWRFADCLFAPA